MFFKLFIMSFWCCVSGVFLSGVCGLVFSGIVFPLVIFGLVFPDFFGVFWSGVFPTNMR